MKTLNFDGLLTAFRVACAVAGTSINKKAKDFDISGPTLHLTLRGTGTSEPTLNKILAFITEIDETLFDKYDVYESNLEPLDA